MTDLEGLSLPELFDHLADLSMPAPVPMVPATAAWVWVGGAVTVLACLLVVRFRRRWRARAYRREALRALRVLDKRGNRSIRLQTLATVLRRTALATFPRDQVAGLHGEAWLRFLDLRQGHTAFATDLGRILIQAPYAGHSDATSDQVEALTRLVRTWIRRHRA